VERGQPPSGHGIPESPPPGGPGEVHTELTHVWPASHAKLTPQPLQFFGSLVVSVHVPLQSVGAFAGQLPTQP
jgi:hypothetical protein